MTLWTGLDRVPTPWSDNRSVRWTRGRVMGARPLYMRSGAVGVGGRGPALAPRSSHPRTSEPPRTIRPLFVPDTVPPGTASRGALATQTVYSGPLSSDPGEVDGGVSQPLDPCQWLSFADRLALAADAASIPDGLLQFTYQQQPPQSLPVVTNEWRDFLVRWWLTGLPLGSLLRVPAVGFDRPEFVRYGNVLFRTTGLYGTTLAQRLEMAAALDVLASQASWVRGYSWRDGDGTHAVGSRVIDLVTESGGATVVIAVWSEEQGRAVTGAQNEGLLGATYQLARLQSYDAVERAAIRRAVGDLEADHVIFMPDGAWRFGSTGDTWQFLLESNGSAGLLGVPGLGCGPADQGFVPALTPVRTSNWTLGRRSGEAAALILESPWRELIDALGQVNTFAVDVAAPTRWITMYSTLVHELFHAAFAESGIRSGDAVCEGDPAIPIAQADGPVEWAGSAHYLCELAGNETAERFVFGQPLGFATARRCGQ